MGLDVVFRAKKEFFLRGQARWKRFAYVIQQKQTECCFAAIAAVCFCTWSFWSLLYSSH